MKLSVFTRLLLALLVLLAIGYGSNYASMSTCERSLKQVPAGAQKKLVWLDPSAVIEERSSNLKSRFTRAVVPWFLREYQYSVGPDVFSNIYSWGYYKARLLRYPFVVDIKATYFSSRDSKFSSLNTAGVTMRHRYICFYGMILSEHHEEESIIN